MRVIQIQAPLSNSISTQPSIESVPVKLPILGLIDMQDISWHNSTVSAPARAPVFTLDNVNRFLDSSQPPQGVFGGIVLNIRWSDIQPTELGSLNFEPIDTALEAVRSYNESHPQTPLGVKLRIYSGSDSPDWAKSIGGSPIQIYRNPAGCVVQGQQQVDTCPLTVGRFWASDFISKWRSFQSLVAAKYDSEPLIRQVAVTSCTSQTDEPFVPSVGPISKQNLKAAGYTDAREKACLVSALEDYAAWKTTLIDYTFNTFVSINGGTDDSFSISVIDNCHNTLGKRCVLDNHALSYPLRQAGNAIYNEIKALGALGSPINFQTEAPKAMNCLWTATIAQGVQLGATAIEIWPASKYAGFDSLTRDQLKELVSEFSLSNLESLLVEPSSPNCPGFQ